MANRFQLFCNGFVPADIRSDRQHYTVPTPAAHHQCLSFHRGRDVYLDKDNRAVSAALGEPSLQPKMNTHEMLKSFKFKSSEMRAAICSLDLAEENNQKVVVLITMLE